VFLSAADEMYQIKYSPGSKDDLRELAYTIAITYGMPKTAEKYVRELSDKILSLSKNPERYAIRTNRSLFQYGMNVRRVDYKKMAILYTINGDTVYIHRVIAGSMITGL